MKKAMLKSGDEIDICDLRMICKENRLYFYNLHETPEFKYQKEINHPGMATDIVSTRKGYPIYHRSPRIRESLPVDEVRLSHLPNKTTKIFYQKSELFATFKQRCHGGSINCHVDFFSCYACYARGDDDFSCWEFDWKQ